MFGQSLERNDLSLRWLSYGGTSELSVTPIHQQTSDELAVQEVVKLTHTFPASYLAPGLVAKLNCLATISSLEPPDDSGMARLVSKVGIYRGARSAAVLLYAPLLCTEAIVIGWNAARIARKSPGQCHLGMMSEDPQFDDEDFRSLKEFINRIGRFYTLGDRHWAAEFPWDDGAVTSVFPREEFREHARRSSELSDERIDQYTGRTSLLRIRITEHPFYGKGVFATLELPVEPDHSLSVPLAMELNDWELTTAHLPPHFGAWCLGERALSYVSFMPTQYCVPDLLPNLTVWMSARQHRVRELLLDSPTSH